MRKGDPVLEAKQVFFRTSENRKRNCKKVATTLFGLAQEQELELICVA